MLHKKNILKIDLELLTRYNLLVDVIGDITPEAEFTFDSREVTSNKIACIDNSNFQYIEQIFKAKPLAIISDRIIDYDPCIIVRDTMLVIGTLLHEIYDIENWTKIIAITGTNGKTSVANFALQLAEKIGKSAISVGTLGVQGKGFENYPNAGTKSHILTTPDISYMHKLWADASNAKTDYMFLEASSHGLEQGRLTGLDIDVGVFTNFSQDHLDYHGDMLSYLEAKLLLFNTYLKYNGTSIYNDAIIQTDNFNYGYNKNSSFRIKKITATNNGTEAKISIFNKNYKFRTEIFGEFQIENILAAITILYSLGHKIEDIIQHIGAIKTAPGRLEYIGETKSGAGILVDYAHSPDALLNLLKAMRLHTTKKLWLIFGCGGDRDTSKRQLMGEIAHTHADKIIITDDNPRHEDPSKIRQMIIEACPNAIEIGDRFQAIKHAIDNASKEDLILIAGKGHEDYQIIGDEKQPFDDRAIAREFTL